MKIRTTAVALLALLVAGCWESDTNYFTRVATYRQPRNSMREQKGIPVVPPNWIVREDRSAVAWDNPAFKNGSNTPMHQYKFLIFDNPGDSGVIVAETDHYATGKTWVDADAGTMHEYVRITYRFDLERQGQPPWEAESLQSGSGPRKIALVQAEQILHEWGIERLEPVPSASGSAQPYGAANRSQPVRSETNRASAAAGSGR
jgi:hypothetical protein